MGKKYISLSVRFVIILALCTIIPMAVLSFLFLNYERKKALEQYIEQSEASMNISVKNIEHYINTSVSSVRNVYVDSNVLNMLSNSSPQDFLSRDLEKPQEIFSFMQSIYTVTPDAVQIRLISHRLNKSFLLITETLQKSLLSVGVSELDLPSFSSPTDVYIEPTHSRHTYGHTIAYYSQPDNSQKVFTIWLPIFKLDVSRNLLGILSIDMPISFIETNCRFSYNTSESILVSYYMGNVIASTDSDENGQDIRDPLLLDFIAQPSDTFSWKVSDTQLYLKYAFSPSYLQWQLLRAVPIESVYEGVNTQLIFLMGVFAAGVFLAISLNSITVAHFTKPLRKAAAYMRDVRTSQAGTSLQLSDYIRYKGNDELKILFHSLEEMMDSIENHTLREYRLKLLNQSTLLKMFQAQINPHFIYNTLQCLATNALKSHDVDQYDYISSLGQMMQYAMDLSHPLAALSDELTYAIHYFNLQKMRFKSAGTLCFGEDLPMAYQIPKMTLQPIIENSIYHDRILEKDQGWIRILVSETDTCLSILVEDNGVPIAPEAKQSLDDSFASIKKAFLENLPDSYVFSEMPSPYSLTASSHIGIENVYKRILLNFGPQCTMELFPNSFDGTTVKIVMIPSMYDLPGEQTDESTDC